MDHEVTQPSKTTDQSSKLPKINMISSLTAYSLANFYKWKNRNILFLRMFFKIFKIGLDKRPNTRSVSPVINKELVLNSVTVNINFGGDFNELGVGHQVM